MIVNVSYHVIWHLFCLFLPLGVQCSVPITQPNGVFSPIQQQYVYGDRVSYSCNNGYALNGAESRDCQVDGLWSETASATACEGILYALLWYV